MSTPKVNDRIFIEDAWEDEAGTYHDEYAIVEAIGANGFMQLRFEREDITEFLRSAEFNVKDYESEA
jgi:hypothetical protein